MNTPRAMVWGAVAAALACGRAPAQNAIGNGTRLDRNLQTGSGGINHPTGDLNAEMRFRNAVVTGNAPNGLSFRGGVGYVAPGEFFGRLGSNSLFQFRRDSINSGMAGLGIRGTDALQYQFALTTGNAPPAGLVGPGYVERSGAGARAVNLSAREGGAFQAPLGRISPDDPQADPRGQELWTLRSPSGYMATRGLSPSLVATGATADGRQYGIRASPLLGLAGGPLDYARPAEPAEGEAMLPEPPPGSARAMDLRADLKAQEPTAVARDEGAEASRPGLERAGLSGYELLTDRMAKALPGKSGADERAKPLWQQRIDELRKQLDESRKPLAQKEPDGAEGDEPDGPGGFRTETLKLLRDAGGPVARLAPEGVDAYAVHMQKAEEYLKQGQFFFAEERFRAALSARPDDPMAAIGRVHAQLGASLYASAALNLRMLLVSHPELVSARYGPDVLPDPARIRTIIERLEAQVAAGKGFGRDTGLLIAYLGYQASDRGATERGLAIMDGGAGPADPQLQKLSSLLRAVWLGATEQGK